MRELLLESCTSGKDILGLMHEKGVRVEDLVENLDSYELVETHHDQVISKEIAFAAFNAFIECSNFHQEFYDWHNSMCTKEKEKNRVMFGKGIRPNKFVQKLRRHIKDKRSINLALKDHMEGEYLQLDQDSACFYIFSVLYDFLDVAIRSPIGLYLEREANNMVVEVEVMKALGFLEKSNGIPGTMDIELPKTVGEIIPPSNALTIHAEARTNQFTFSDGKSTSFVSRFLRTHYAELLDIICDKANHEFVFSEAPLMEAYTEEYESYMTTALDLILHVKDISAIFDWQKPWNSTNNMRAMSKQHPIIIVGGPNYSIDLFNNYDSTSNLSVRNKLVFTVLQYAHVTRVAPSFEREPSPGSNGSSSSSSGKSSKPYVKPTYKVVHLPHVVMPRDNTKQSQPTGKKHIFRGRRETVRNYNHDRYINMKGKSQVIRAISDPLGEKPTEIIYSVRTPKGYAKDSKPVTGRDS